MQHEINVLLEALGHCLVRTLPAFVGNGNPSTLISKCIIESGHQCLKDYKAEVALKVYQRKVAQKYNPIRFYASQSFECFELTKRFSFTKKQVVFSLTETSSANYIVFHMGVKLNHESVECVQVKQQINGKVSVVHNRMNLLLFLCL